MDLWELLDDLRDYACSTHTAFFPEVFDHPYNVPVVEEMDKRVVYTATEYFGIFEALLREDVEIIDLLLNRILAQTGTPITSRKTRKSA